MCVLVCLFVIVQYDDNLEATALVCVHALVCLFVMVQFGEYLEVTALVVCTLCMYL